MIPELGNFALACALALALIQFIGPLLGLKIHHWRLVLLAKFASSGQFVFVSLSFICLAWSFYANDFSVAYVASHSNRTLPDIYRLGATWGGHEGSLLLWVFMLAGWTFAVNMMSKSLPVLTQARVLSVLGGVSVGFLAFILFTSNPFDRSFPLYPIDGSDLNPLLQDPGMVFHPPLLYMGYVGFSVAFAFALAALMEGRIDTLWARWVRPWTQAAWLFLTLGIAAGSWWAYYELGWGGWWFWDPVENASFMPWLIGTALLHSLAATEKRGVFKAWTALLAIAAFSFSLLGTFLVRSGVLTSVHAFANDPVRGTYILVFLGVVVGTSLLLFSTRASKVSVVSWYSGMSREVLFLLNNLLLFVATIMILVGTLQPIIAELFNLGKISVGPPYFNLVFSVLMAPLVFLAGLGPITRWRNNQPSKVFGQTKVPTFFSFALGITFVALEWQKTNLELAQIFIGVFLAVWVASITLIDWIKREFATANRAGRLVRTSMSQMGMHVAHIGLAVAVFAVVMSSHLSIEKNIRLSPGSTFQLDEYQFKFDSTSEVIGANYTGIQGVFSVFQDGQEVTKLFPEKRRYKVSGQWMTEAGISASLARDLYVALGERLPDSNDWAVRIYVKPFVSCLWLAGILMALGAFISMLDKRYRQKQPAKAYVKVATRKIAEANT